MTKRKAKKRTFTFWTVAYASRHNIKGGLFRLFRLEEAALDYAQVAADCGDKVLAITKHTVTEGEGLKK